jgi:hypothetical protein
VTFLEQIHHSICRTQMKSPAPGNRHKEKVRLQRDPCLLGAPFPGEASLLAALGSIQGEVGLSVSGGAFRHTSTGNRQGAGEGTRTAGPLPLRRCCYTLDRPTAHTSAVGTKMVSPSLLWLGGPGKIVHLMGFETKGSHCASNTHT